jgi:glycosyltransferase involved in cell wall biosynthesis
MSPLVSVCILTFNSAQFIEQTVHSAMEQSLADLEIVIVDNGSTDTTIEICNELASRDSRISMHVNEMPLGISGGLNRCLELARGQYAKILMHDDLLEPECLKRMISVLEQNPSVSLVGCIEQVIDKDGKLIKSLTPYAQSALVPGRQVMKRLLLSMSNEIGTPTSMLMKRESYGTGFDRSLFLYLDMDMWLKVLSEGDYYFIHEPLSRLRVHAGTGSTINSKTLLFVADMLKLKDMYADFMEQEGVSKQQWAEIIDRRILAAAGYVLFEEGLKVEELCAYAHRLRSMVGYDYTNQLLEAMAKVNFYALSRLFKTDLELNWNKQEVQRLDQEINAMSKSLPWKISKPIRELKTKLFSLHATPDTPADK